MQYDDGRFKTEEEAFDSTDLEDQMNALIYPPGLPAIHPAITATPGPCVVRSFL